MTDTPPDIDETSIPPTISEIDDEQFFERGERESLVNLSGGSFEGSAADEEDVLEPGDERRRRLNSPEARARRERFGRIVAICAGGAALVAIVGLVSEVAFHQNASRVQPPASAPLGASAPAEAPLPSALPAASVEPADDVVSAVTAPETAVQQSKVARDEARRALEGRRLEAALLAAEKAAALDPRDADGWLLLGATHLELGHAAKARDAFTACAHHATKGAHGECAALLR